MNLIKNKKDTCEKKDVAEEQDKKEKFISQINPSDGKANKVNVPEIEKREFLKRGAFGLGIGAAAALASKIPFAQARYLPAPAPYIEAANADLAAVYELSGQSEATVTTGLDLTSNYYGQSHEVSAATINGWTNSTWTDIFDISFSYPVWITFTGKTCWATATGGQNLASVSLAAADNGSLIGIKCILDGNTIADFSFTGDGTLKNFGAGLPEQAIGGSATWPGEGSVSMPIKANTSYVVQGMRTGAITASAIIASYPQYWKR